MNRILFQLVVAFALGEVLQLNPKGVSTISIVVAMLICVVVLLIRFKKYRVRLCLLVLMFVAGSFLTFGAEHKRLGIGKLSGHVSICGMVADRQGEGQYKILVSSITCNGCTKDISRIYKMGVLIMGIEDELTLGDEIVMTGAIKHFDKPTNPGEFDKESYYLARGMWFELSDSKLISITQKKGCNILYRLRGGLYSVRQLLDDKLGLITDAKTASLYKGILLGDKSDIESLTKKKYQVAGIAHILAISGLHISMIGMTVFKLLRGIGTVYGVSGIVSITVTLLYGAMTGYGMATIRAVIMLVILFIGEIFGKRYDLLTGLSVAVFIMLIANPYRILDSGMLLSVAAVFGVALSQYIMRFLCREYPGIKRIKKRKRLLYRFINSIIMSFAIQLTIAPVLLWTSYVLPVYSPIINLLVVPLMTVVVAVGMLGISLSFFSVKLAGFVILPGKMILKLFEYVCEITVRLPFTGLNPGRPSICAIIIYYIFLMLMILLCNSKIRQRLRKLIYRHFHYWFDVKHWHRFMIIFRVVLLFLYCSVALIVHLSMQREKIVFLDVGQGDGILIVTPGGTNMVIDGGTTSKNKCGEYILMPAIKALGMSHISYWFVSHTDNDHISGLMEILELGRVSGIRIDNIVLAKHGGFLDSQDSNYELLIEAAKACGIKLIYMDKGDCIAGKDFTIRARHPGKEYVYIKNSNDNDNSTIVKDKNALSLVLSYSSKDLSALFTGDIDFEALEYMFSSKSDEESWDVIKLPHHGSRYSIHNRLYNGVRSGIVVISCGRNNRYGHPHKETLECLEEVGARVLRTDEVGAIEIQGEGYENRHYFGYTQ